MPQAELRPCEGHSPHTFNTRRPWRTRRSSRHVHGRLKVTMAYPMAFCQLIPNPPRDPDSGQDPAALVPTTSRCLSFLPYTDTIITSNFLASAGPYTKLSQSMLYDIS